MASKVLQLEVREMTGVKPENLTEHVRRLVTEEVTTAVSLKFEAHLES